MYTFCQCCLKLTAIAQEEPNECYPVTCAMFAVTYAIHTHET
jgi:hypothetical protein